MSDAVLACGTFGTLAAFAAVAAYLIRSHYADRREARVHEAKLSGELAVKIEQLLPLDEHVRTSLENFKNTLVAALKEQREIVKGLDTENKRVVTGKVAKNLLGGRGLPEP